MRYQGGKSKIAKDIAHYINSLLEVNTHFVSLFCGSCAIESKIISKSKLLNDNHFYLIQMWKGIQAGYQLPDFVSKETYHYIKNNIEKDPCLSGFVGFGCSFGGEWFGGYASSSDSRNYAKEAKNSLLRILPTLAEANFICEDYKKVQIPLDAVVYADPPYANTKGYQTGDFDSCDFWNYMRELSEEHVVLISEENAPDDFVEIWSKSVKRTLDVNKKNQPTKIEKLFIHNTYKNLIIKK